MSRNEHVHHCALCTYSTYSTTLILYMLTGHLNYKLHVYVYVCKMVYTRNWLRTDVRAHALSVCAQHACDTCVYV